MANAFVKEVICFLQKFIVKKLKVAFGMNAQCMDICYPHAGSRFAVIKNNMERQTNYAFIDSQNLNLAIRDQGWILDFGRFKQYLKDKYSIQKAFLFIGYVQANKTLYTALQSQGYILVFKPTLELPNKTIKGNVDAELVLHAMIEYNNYEKTVIVTGDGDFYCLVDYLNKQNKLLKLLIPNVRKYSKLLKPFAPNKIDFMNNLNNKLSYKNTKEPIT